MAAKKPITREYRIYLAIWRKAYLEKDAPFPKNVEINASSFSMAISMRQGMYRAIRPYRYGEEFDPELTKASEHFVVTLPTVAPADRAKPCKLVLAPRLALGELEKELLNLGLDSEDLLTHEEKIANIEIEKLSSDEVIEFSKRSSTPFYTREN